MADPYKDCVEKTRQLLTLLQELLGEKSGYLNQNIESVHEFIKHVKTLQQQMTNPKSNVRKISANGTGVSADGTGISTEADLLVSLCKTPLARFNLCDKNHTIADILKKYGKGRTDDYKETAIRYLDELLRCTEPLSLLEFTEEIQVQITSEKQDLIDQLKEMNIQFLSSGAKVLCDPMFAVKLLDVFTVPSFRSNIYNTMCLPEEVAETVDAWIRDVLDQDTNTSLILFLNQFVFPRPVRYASLKFYEHVKRFFNEVFENSRVIKEYWARSLEKQYSFCDSQQGNTRSSPGNTRSPQGNRFPDGNIRNPGKTKPLMFQYVGSMTQEEAKRFNFEAVVENLQLTTLKDVSFSPRTVLLQKTIFQQKFVALLLVAFNTLQTTHCVKWLKEFPTRRFSPADITRWMDTMNLEIDTRFAEQIAEMITRLFVSMEKKTSEELDIDPSLLMFGVVLLVKKEFYIYLTHLCFTSSFVEQADTYTNRFYNLGAAGNNTGGTCQKGQVSCPGKDVPSSKGQVPCPGQEPSGDGNLNTNITYLFESFSEHVKPFLRITKFFSNNRTYRQIFDLLSSQEFATKTQIQTTTEKIKTKRR